MRAFFVLMFGVLFSSYVCAAENTKCVPIENLFRVHAATLGSHGYNGIQLKRSGSVKFLIFLAMPDPKNVTGLSRWLVAQPVSEEKPEIYCIRAEGGKTYQLKVPQNPNPQDIYGMPGSGHARCGDPRDPLEGLKVRVSAARELGPSTVFSLDQPAAKGATYILLLSQLDPHWIMLEKRPGEGTCFLDQGEAADIRTGLN